MVFTEFCTMFLGAKLLIHTNYLKNTTNNTTPDLIIYWLNFVEKCNL